MKKLITLLTFCLLFLLTLPVSADTIESPKVTAMELDSVTGLLRINWEDIEGAVSYKLYMKEDGQWKELIQEQYNTVPGSEAKAVAEKMKLQYGKPYTLAVTAVDENCEESSIDDDGQTYTIITIEKLKVENTTKGIKISWKKCAGVTSFKILRNGKEYKTLSKGSYTTFTDTSIKSGSTYRYEVIPYSDLGVYSGEAESNVKSICRIATPKITYGKSSGKKITIRWKKVAGATKYEIYCKANGKNGVLSNVVKANKLSCTTPKLLKGKKYTLKVRAIKGKSVSAWSSAKIVKVK